MFYNNSILQQSQQSLSLDETNGNVVMPSTSTGNTTSNVLVPMSPTSNDEDDRSEYTDADSNQISAPTELLAEFLSAVMEKDYKNALKYCKLILQYEPNASVKDFYPHLLSKLHEQEQKNSSSEGSDENFNTSSMEFVDLDNENDQVDLLQEDNLSEASLPSIASTVSSLDGNYPDFNDEGGGSDYSNSNSENSEQNSDKDHEELIPESADSNPASNSSSILPEQIQKSSFSLTSTSSNYSNKEDTSHSYTSLLLEEDDDAEMLPVPPIQQDSTSSPLARKIVELLKAKCIPGHSSFKPKEN